MQVIDLGSLGQLENPLLVDVRSPTEFEEDHLPGAINLPVLSNEERDRIGTIYNQQSQFKARREGAKTICSNVPDIIDEIDERVTRDRPIVLYCWRGGQRSRSLSIILDRIGYDVNRLEGGYKSYRKHVHDYLRNTEWNKPLVTLYGLTGSGKTKLLKKLQSKGHSILNLEGCARHRGSAFGGIGLDDQPTQKTFERKLYVELKDSTVPIYSEGESRKIGQRTIPEALFESLTDPPRVWVKTPIDRRIEVIRDEYPWPECREALIDSVGKLKERLGSSTVDILQKKLEDDSLDEAIRILLEQYYDPAYKCSSPDTEEFDLIIENESWDSTVNQLLSFGEETTTS